MLFNSGLSDHKCPVIYRLSFPCSLSLHVCVCLQICHIDDDNHYYFHLLTIIIY